MFRKAFSLVLLSALLAVIAAGGAWAEELPISYDLRGKDGLVPSEVFSSVVPSGVRNQGNWGLCWAFGALASIESNYMMGVSEDKTFAIPALYNGDYPESTDDPRTSELHLGWFAHKAETGKEYRVFSVVSGDKDLLSMKQLEANPGKVLKGASWEATIAFLARGFGYGPVPSSELSYPTAYETIAEATNATLNDLLTKGTLAKEPTASQYHSALWVTNLDTLKYPEPTATDFATRRDAVIKEVKELILDRGAIALDYKDADDSRNEEHQTYYCSEADITKLKATKPDSVSGHVVAVVGWDDTFSKENFMMPGRDMPTIDGAWLIRNSWGSRDTDTHINGYFWMSYEQQAGFQSYEVISADKDVVCYEWDPLGWCSDWGGLWKTEDSYAVNVFKTGDEPVTLNRIGFYTANENAELTLYVRDYGTTKPTEANVWTAEPILTTTVSRDYVGYHTVPLDQDPEVTIPANSYFSVGMKVDKSFETPIAVETRLKGYSDYARVADGESFFSTDGTTWTDGTKMTRTNSNNQTLVSPMNACIKVFVTGAQEQPEEDWFINGKRVIDRPEDTVADAYLMEANNPSGENAAVTTGREFSLFLLDSGDAPLAEGTEVELTFMFQGSGLSYDQYYVPEDEGESYTDGTGETHYYGYDEKPGDEWGFSLYPEGYEPEVYVNDEGELFASYQKTVTVGANGNVTLNADDIPTATEGHSAPAGYYDVFYEVSGDESPDVGTLPVIHITAQEDSEGSKNSSNHGSSGGCDLGLGGWLALGLAGLAVSLRKQQ